MGIEACFFSARSAYAAIDGSGDSERDELWRFVWKLALPQRIRVFMWLAIRTGMEDVLHVLCNCYKARGVWRLLLPVGLLQGFIAVPIKEWFQANLPQPSQFSSLHDCCMLWNRRNKLLFDPEFIEKEDIVALSRRYMEEVRVVMEAGRLSDTLADRLASMGRGQPLGETTSDVPPIQVMEMLQHDPQHSDAVD
ncbi:hypothetical protein V6N13_120551 [Hibiscus sabdariffa]